MTENLKGMGKLPGHPILWHVASSILSAIVFYIVYKVYLSQGPNDPFFWDGFFKFLWIWFWNFVVSVSIHLIVSAITRYDYQISNFQSLTFHVIKSFIYAIFVDAGAYGWLLGFIPLTFGFDDAGFNLISLFIAFIFLQLIAFSIAYPISMAVGTWASSGIARAGPRVGFGKTRQKHKEA